MKNCRFLEWRTLQLFLVECYDYQAGQRKGRGVHPGIEPVAASLSDLDALPTETWLATSSSAKGMDGTGTAARRQEGKAAKQVSNRVNPASFSSWGRLTACSMRSGTEARSPGMAGTLHKIPQCPSRSHSPSSSQCLVLFVAVRVIGYAPPPSSGLPGHLLPAGRTV